MKSIHKIKHDIACIVLIVLTIIALITNLLGDDASNKIQSILNTMIFTLTMLSYYNYNKAMYKGVYELCISELLVLLSYIITGQSLMTSIAAVGVTLPISIIGVAIVILIPTISRSREKARATKDCVEAVKITAKDKLSSAIKIKGAYKFIIICTLITIFVNMYNNSHLDSITNKTLKTVLVLEYLLPELIALAYITFTDITFGLIIAYYIVYVVAYIIGMNIDGMQIFNSEYTVYIIEFTIVVISLIIRNIKLGQDNRKEEVEHE